MTDLDRTKQFLDSLGVLYSQDEIGDRMSYKEDIVPVHTLVFGCENYRDDGYPPCDKVGGYPGFYTCFNFDESGKFLTVGVWE